MFHLAAKVSQRFSYPLSGADRFQLYFDEIARKNTGIGNVIRAAITLEGIIPEEIIRQNIGENEWVRFLSGLILKKNNFSALFRFENGGNHHQSIITFHQVTFREVMNL